MSFTKKAVFNIKLAEIEQAAITLFYAFENDPLMLWIFGDKQSYKAKAIPLFKTWIKYCVLYGLALRTDNFESVGLRKKPGDLKLSFWRILRSGMYKNPKILGESGFKRLMDFDDLTSQARKNLMAKQSYWYCWMIGTKPEFQNQGFGRAIMDYTLDLAKKTNLPCYLETASKGAIQVHCSKGFEILSEIQLTGSEVKITLMKKL
jgi:GNAT superfamily N-acetyltransferase